MSCCCGLREWEHHVALLAADIFFSDTGVGISLVSKLQNHDEAGTGYTGRDLLLVDNEEMI